MNTWLNFYAFEGLQRAIPLFQFDVLQKFFLLENREQLKFQI